VMGGPPARGWSLLDDGRVLHRDARTGTMVMLDPETGVRVDLGIDARSGYPYARTPGGAHLVEFSRQASNETVHARLNSETGEIVTIPGLAPYTRHTDLIAILDETTMLFLQDRRRIVRVVLGKDEVEVLFPR